MSYHNAPQYVPWQMPCWNMCYNDILRKFLHQHVIMVDMLFLQQNQYNELDATTYMNMEMNLHPTQNEEVNETQSKKEHKGREKETAKMKGYSKKTEEWISSGKFFTKNNNSKDKGKQTQKDTNRYQVLDDFEEVYKMMQLQENKISSNIAIHELKKEKEELEERYDIEEMTTDALQAYLKSS